MRNIFLFIRRYFVFITFLVMQGFALWMIFKYNRFHRAAFLGVSSELTGRVNTQVDKVDDYFNLREENRRVHRMNDSLMNLLKKNYWLPDSSIRAITDSVLINDSTKAVRRYLWREAKVVFTSVNSDQNYLQINRGSAQGIRDNMAVLNSDGALVGLVVNVSTNFSQVMSLLHKKSRVPAALKGATVFGTLEWDGIDPRFVLLQGISKDLPVKNGDSVLTSIYSYNFPPGSLIGTVAAISIDKASGFYILKIKTAVSFSAIQQVFVVDNLQKAEQEKLEEDTKRKIEDQKRSIP